MKYLIAALFVSAALPGLAAAQSTPRQGTLGSSSDGAIGMTLNVAESKRIEVNGLVDLTFDTEKGMAPSPMRQNICVYMDEPGTYDVTVTAQPFQSPNLADESFTLGYYALNEQGTVVGRDIVEIDGTTTGFSLTGLPPSPIRHCPYWIIARLTISFPEVIDQVGTFTTIVTILVEPT